MMDLGRKSRQIGSVLEIASELAEQTNIASVAQARRETEATTGQTLSTAAQLSTSSRALHRSVQAQAA